MLGKDKSIYTNIENIMMTDEVSKGEEYKVISEQRKTVLVEKPDGQRVYICKLCGEEIGEMNQVARHFRKYHSAEKEERTRDLQPEPMRSRIPTPEEEMLEDMCTTLKTQMEAAPGIGPGSKTDWFVNVFFRNNPILQENPQELFKALRRNFPKADDDAISWIVSAVFKIRENYKKSISTFAHNDSIGFQHSYTHVPYAVSTPHDSGSFSFVFTIMQQMMNQQQQFYNMLIQEIKNKPNPEAIRAQVENEFLKRHLEKLENQINKMTEVLATSGSRVSVSPEGWRDDYARLIAEMGTKIIDLGERIIVENKKFRQTLIKYLAPKLFKEEKELAPSGAGRTDEEIVRELEEEGLVEG